MSIITFVSKPMKMNQKDIKISPPIFDSAFKYGGRMGFANKWKGSGVLIP